MKRRTFVQLPLLSLIPSVRLPLGVAAVPQDARPQTSFEGALVSTLDRFHGQFDVYSNVDAAGNHFIELARLYSMPDDERAASGAVPAMDQDATINGRPGTCIRASFQPRGNDFGGWMFLNGTLRATERAPHVNFGTEPDSGVDLSGATRLSFVAAGARGGERVEFFAFGAGRDSDTGAPLPGFPFPDSSRKASTGYITLSTDFRPFSIDLRGRDPASLRSVLNGFGWVASAERNRNLPITFFIDNVRYDKPRLDEPRLPLSFESIGAVEPDRVLRNVSFTYDAAVAMMALIAANDVRHARLIAQALANARSYDRFYTDHSLRNGYAAGDQFVPRGWTPNGRPRSVRMPGWFGRDETDQQIKWLEDEFQVSTHVGNVAWALLALLAFYEATEQQLSVAVRQPYLDAALDLGTWIVDQCTDPRGGYRGGFNGWEPNRRPIDYRATEHNIDLVAAFSRLSKASAQSAWMDCSEHARLFVEAMWDPTEQKFWTGTLGGSDDPNIHPVPLDVQAWSVLALGSRGRRGENYGAALDFAERRILSESGGGFAFSDADRSGTWYEGTAHMVSVYRATGQAQKADRYAAVLRMAMLDSGAMPAVNTPRLYTGFDLIQGKPWYYYPWAHTGATAWAALAVRGTNPFSPFSPLPPR